MKSQPSTLPRRSLAIFHIVRFDTEPAGLIPRLKGYVLEHIAVTNLTLKWIAQRVLYISEDYFSQYPIMRFYVM